MAISGLTVSTNGACGPAMMQTCLGDPSGESCSKWGYCGPQSAIEFSGDGCQPLYGLCGPLSSSVTSDSVTSTSFTTFTTIVLTSSTSLSSTTSALSTSETPPSSTASPPAYSAPPAPSSSSAPVAYNVYLGAGDTSQGWPAQDSWLDFDSLFAANANIMNASCAQWNVPDNTDAEISDLKTAILSEATASDLDARFILAIVLQESNGCVRAPTTQNSVPNPGLMQSYNGQGTCNTGTITAPQSTEPCPADEIAQMIRDGTAGTGSGSTSLVQAIGQAGCADVSKYYKAARIYNSGSIAESGLLQEGVATHCYSSDIANRLLGWNGVMLSTCELN